jgi:glycosyltransferase involved in cell wall biosynthesis
LIADRRVVVGFIGVHAGQRPGQAVAQNETLAALLTDVGHDVHNASAIRRPLLRTLHQACATVWWGRKVDVLVLATFSGRSFWYADLVSMLARLTRTPLVMVLHGGKLPEYRAAYPNRVHRVIRRAACLVAPSRFLARAFEGAGFDVDVIPNVLAIERYEYRHRLHARPRLLWMRTFHEHYHPELAVEVLARVQAVHPDAVLTMGGADHGSLDATRERASRLGVSDAVYFAGYLDAAAKARAFADHDLFVNTNRIDNMPVSVLEAAAAGLVPVATRAGGLPDLITDGVDGVLVPIDDADAMAEAVLALLADDARYQRLGSGARALAERSSWANTFPMWRDEFDAAIAAQGR